MISKKKNKKITESVQGNQLSNSNTQIFKSDLATIYEQLYTIFMDVFKNDNTKVVRLIEDIKKIIDMKKKIDKDKKAIVELIAEYNDFELKEVLSELKSGHKQRKYNRMIKHFEKKFEENDEEENEEEDENNKEDELPKRRCKVCKKYKILSYDNFVPVVKSGFVHKCRECESTILSEIVTRMIANK